MTAPTDRPVQAAIAAALRDARPPWRPISDIAREMNCNANTVGSWFRGERAIPLRRLFELAAALGVDVVDLVAAAQRRMEAR